jgi:hypothetical protein
MAGQLIRERALILVKAAPNITRNNRELVCCAGVTPELEWRRQYPIRYRHLVEKFKRWDWVEYECYVPRDDSRWESRRVKEDSIIRVDHLTRNKRAQFLQPLVVSSTNYAASIGRSLAIVRPQSMKFYWKKKSLEELEQEKRDCIAAASQFSMFDDELEALDPCPFEFRIDHVTEDAKPHTHECLDWETLAWYWRLTKVQKMPPNEALEEMNRVLNEEYPTKGVALAFGTHSRRHHQWLLIGIIRLDEPDQQALL